ncbi:MAG: glutaminyl-peptide cyclotransferase [Myxococcales bacterium]|nr:glutaminyl-peptide cyclotransferase [Myxococcales bacterium]
MKLITLPTPQSYLPRVLTAAYLMIAGYSLQSTAAEAGFVPDKVLRVCSDPNNLPFANRAGAGFENAIAERLAEKLGLKLEYTWYPQRVGFIRNTLKSWSEEEERFRCDLVIGLPVGFDQTDTTKPYYRSTYALIYPREGKVAQHEPQKGLLANLSREDQNQIRIGLFAPSPAVSWLRRRGLFNRSLHQTIMSGDPEHYPGKLLEEELVQGTVDGVVIWGPIAGSFSRRTTGASSPWTVQLLRDEPGSKFEFDIAMGLRRGDGEWKALLDKTLAEIKPELQAILQRFGIPMLDRVSGETGASPEGSTEWIIVSNEHSGELSLIEPGTWSVSTFPVGRRPRGMKATKDGRIVFVALSGSPRCPPSLSDEECAKKKVHKADDGIARVDWRRKAVVETFFGGSDPEQFDILEGETQTSSALRIFVANEDVGLLSVVNTRTKGVVGSVEVGGEPEGVRVSPDGSTVVVTSEEDGLVTFVDTKDYEAKGQVHVGARPRDLVFGQAGQRLYVSAEASSRVDVIDVPSKKRLESIELPAGSLPMGLALSGDGRHLYVTTGRAKKLLSVDLSTGKVVRSVEVGVRPWGIAIGGDGSRIYTANGPSNDVTVVDAKTFSVLRKISVGTSPWDVVVVQEPTQ